eukprot:5822758-Amphidinium_carterae.1
MELKYYFGCGLMHGVKRDKLPSRLPPSNLMCEFCNVWVRLGGAELRLRCDLSWNGWQGSRTIAAEVTTVTVHAARVTLCLAPTPHDPAQLLPPMQQSRARTKS